MYSQCLYDWDGLAHQVWDLFEDNGLNPGLLVDELESLRLPLAVVGCGRGATLKYLQKFFGGDQVMGFDSSEEMVKLARERGCSHVYQVSPEEPIPVGVRFATVLIATGVLDPLEADEIGTLCRTLRPQVADDGEVWVYAFGRFGPHWTAAQVLGATEPLGISNEVLFDLYEKATRTSTADVIRLLGLNGVDALTGKVWLASIGRLVKTVLATGTVDDASSALGLVRRMTPSLSRRFAIEELKSATARGGLYTTSQQLYERLGVLRFICHQAPVIEKYPQEEACQKSIP